MIVAIVLCILFVLTATGFAVWKAVRVANQFKPLPGWPMASCAAPDGVPLGRVSDAIGMSIVLLKEFRGWDVREVAERCNYIVMQADEWTDRFGRKVAGTAMPGCVQVGRNLAAMCHELAHAYELAKDGRTDESHEAWQTNGVQRAIDEYERWVTK